MMRKPVLYGAVNSANVPVMSHRELRSVRNWITNRRFLGDYQTYTIVKAIARGKWETVTLSVTKVPSISDNFV